MVRVAINNRIIGLKLSKQKVALDNNLFYTDFNEFILERKSLPVEHIEKVLEYLRLEIATKLK